MKRFIRIILPAILAIIALVVLTVPAYAATTATITVTNTPQFLGITVAPTTYNFNATGAAHPNVMPNTTYYSNPLGQTTAPSATAVDGECAFTITNTSNVGTDLTLTWSDFAGGSDNSTNGNTGTAGATSYGAYSYFSGIALASKVLLKSAGSGVGYSNLGATTNIKFGVQYNTQTSAWTGATATTSTITITTAAH